MIPVVTKHYGLGLLAGTGCGLFLAGILIESGGGDGIRPVLRGVGLLGMIVGGGWYALSVRKPSNTTV